MRPTRKKALLSQELADQIKPILAHNDPSIQSATLADLLAMWVAGHAPELREEVLDMHIRLVRDLVPINEEMMFGEAGHPAGKGS